MAKSKQQKRDEARERNLRHWQDRFDWYASQQHPCPGYHENVKRFGTEQADMRADDARRLFARYCQEVGTDFHGNPVKDT